MNKIANRVYVTISALDPISHNLNKNRAVFTSVKLTITSYICNIMLHVINGNVSIVIFFIFISKLYRRHRNQIFRVRHMFH